VVGKVIILSRGRLPMLIKDWANWVYHKEHLWYYIPKGGGWMI